MQLIKILFRLCVTRSRTLEKHLGTKKYGEITDFGVLKYSYELVKKIKKYPETLNVILSKSGSVRKEGKTVLLIDYVVVSFVGASIVDIVTHLFSDQQECFEIKDSVIRGFNKVMTNGYLFIHYENKGTKPVVLLEIRGLGCRWLEQKFEHSWSAFLSKVLVSPEHILLEKINIKRLDIAFDSFDNSGFTPKRIRRWHNQNLITSRLQKLRDITEWQISSGELTGDSCYFGKRTSDLSCVVYDKKLESNVENIDYWYRCELRLRGTRASRAVEQLLKSPSEFGACIASLLKEVIQFRSSTHNRSELRRRNLAPWYLQYLKQIEKQKLIFF